MAAPSPVKFVAVISDHANHRSPGPLLNSNEFDVENIQAGLTHMSKIEKKPLKPIQVLASCLMEPEKPNNFSLVLQRVENLCSHFFLKYKNTDNKGTSRNTSRNTSLAPPATPGKDNGPALASPGKHLLPQGSSSPPAKVQASGTGNTPTRSPATATPRATSQNQPKEPEASRKDGPKKECRDRDGHRCVLTGTAGPEVCHIIPFAWNMVCLSEQMHTWWGKAYWGFEPLVPVSAEGKYHVTCIFRWVFRKTQEFANTPMEIRKGKNDLKDLLDEVEKWEEGEASDGEEGRMKQPAPSAFTPGGKIGASNVESLAPIRSGREVIFPFDRRDDAWRFYKVMQIQWACVRLSAISGAADVWANEMDDEERRGRTTVRAGETASVEDLGETGGPWLFRRENMPGPISPGQPGAPGSGSPMPLGNLTNRPRPPPTDQPKVGLAVRPRAQASSSSTVPMGAQSPGTKHRENIRPPPNQLENVPLRAGQSALTPAQGPMDSDDDEE
ncbi:hypothetical protein B0I35DRAFT_434653 [Stachybotrys elegans]|uniref:HNH nuclease domain-containing protein n=1 Tax=Stachybotrys elegans TaxID=80388 RepID=A0A8K0SP83_9HYPO|nr:hypothetical protein B0I35DRAFT_434653 [Stachybotrys elegans]